VVGVTSSYLRFLNFKAYRQQPGPLMDADGTLMEQPSSQEWLFWNHECRLVIGEDMNEGTWDWLLACPA